MDKLKYEAICEQLERRINSLPPGSRLPTVRDLIDEFSAGQATIVRALDILESKRLIVRRSNQGIFTAGLSPLEGSVAPLRITIAIPNFISMVSEMYLQELCQAIGGAGHLVQITRFVWQDRIIRSLPKHSCDMLFVLPTGVDLTSSDVARLNSFDVPVVILDRDIRNIAMDYVCVDNIHGGALAAAHFAKLGRKRLAILIGEPKNRNNCDRTAGFMQQCSILGLAAPQILDCETPFGDRSCKASYEMASRIIAAQRQFPFDGVFCVSDETALGLCHALYESGICVPEHVSVVGFDGQPDAVFYNPSLTTVALDLEGMAAKALEIIDAKGVRKELSKVFQFIVPPRLVERKSTAPLLNKQASVASSKHSRSNIDIETETQKGEREYEHHVR